MVDAIHTIATQNVQSQDVREEKKQRKSPLHSQLKLLESLLRAFSASSESSLKSTVFATSQIGQNIFSTFSFSFSPLSFFPQINWDFFPSRSSEENEVDFIEERIARRIEQDRVTQRYYLDFEHLRQRLLFQRLHLVY